MDLAGQRSLDHLFARQSSDPLTLNIGTGRGLGVLDVVHGFEQATGLAIPYEMWSADPAMCLAWRPVPRRPRLYWGGTPSGAWRRCAAMAGPGSRPTGGVSNNP